jgi:hypothetical protein
VNVRAVVALALLGTVALAAVPAPASATPASATPASSEVFTGTVTGSGVIDWNGSQARRDGKPLGQPLVLRGRTGAGIDTAITCHVYGSGPELVGGNVFFSITINCVGGVPQFLQVFQNIARHTALGNWVVEPGSDANCPGSATTILLCGSIATCFQAGANYDGYAVLYGIDEFGVAHWSSYYAPPRWVGCVI